MSDWYMVSYLATLKDLTDDDMRAINRVYHDVPFLRR